MAACDRLLDAAAASGKVLTIGHEFRLSTQWGRLKTLIDEGAIGTPLYANVSLFRFPYRPGSGGWRYDRDQVGSWILEEPVHFFDSVMWYFEELGDPDRIVAFGNGRPVEGTARQRSGHGAQFLDRHALAGRRLCRHHPEPRRLRASSRHGDRRHRRVDPHLVVGRGGPHPRAVLRDQGRSAPASRRPEKLEAAPSGELFELDEELRLAVEAFRANRPIVSGEEARKRILVCLAAEEALAEGEEVKLRLLAAPSNPG